MLPRRLSRCTLYFVLPALVWSQTVPRTAGESSLWEARVGRLFLCPVCLPGTRGAVLTSKLRRTMHSNADNFLQIRPAAPGTPHSRLGRGVDPRGRGPAPCPFPSAVRRSSAILRHTTGSRAVLKGGKKGS